MQKIKNLPKHERPREKMIEIGASNLRDKELLAIILRTGREGKNVLEIAADILRKYPIQKFSSMSYGDLVSIKGIEAGKACSLLAGLELARRALEIEDNSLPIINSCKDALGHLQEIRRAKREHFAVLYLNARNQLINKEIISIGTLNANLVHPREVFKPAVDHLAAKIIIAHNHPSGDTEPSDADRELTERLKKAGELLGIEMLEHLVVTEKDYISI